jgi:NAD-dependent deacetylase
MSDAIARAAEILRSAKSAVAVTGAGLSVPSGIPDFRSPKSGLWAKYDPMKVAHIDAFLARPQDYYDWMRLRLEVFAKAEPNSGHHAIAAMLKSRVLSALVTQNIDGLHERAGGEPIFAVHGTRLTAKCLSCPRKYATNDLLPVVSQGQVPYCECGGLIKPDIVLFGEPLPTNVLAGAQAAAHNADVVLIAGTGLEVYPVAAIPDLVLDNGGQAIVVNRTPTGVDSRAAVVIAGDVAEVLPAVAARLRV